MPPRSPDVLVDSIVLKRQIHKGCFLVVEGIDDLRFFNKFVDHEACRITEARGKENVIEVVSILEKESIRGIVGVIDADFDHIEGNRRPSENIIVLDTVDLEALLIRSPALDAVLAEWGSTKKIVEFGKDIREVLLDAAVWVGCLRLYSSRTQSKFRFRGLKYKKIIDIQSFSLDVVCLVSEVLNRSQKPNLSTEDIVEELKRIHLALKNYWLVCLGKDMVNILAFALKRKVGSNRAKNIKSESISSDLRQSYHRNDLDKSKLGNDLYEWESRNQPFQILKPDE